MIYKILLFISSFCILIGLLLKKRSSIQLKKTGIKTVGVIVGNTGTDGSENSFYQLGGNINNPTIRFFTKTGLEIIGTPVIGFISQHQIFINEEIEVIYDPENPQRFCTA